MRDCGRGNFRSRSRLQYARRREYIDILLQGDDKLLGTPHIARLDVREHLLAMCRSLAVRVSRSYEIQSVELEYHNHKDLISIPCACLGARQGLADLQVIGPSDLCLPEKGTSNQYSTAIAHYCRCPSLAFRVALFWLPACHSCLARHTQSSQSKRAGAPWGDYRDALGGGVQAATLSRCDLV